MASGNNSFVVKHDLLSARVKGVCFHPTRPWLLVGLHSGAVHMIDHSTGRDVARFEEHEGPVRGVDFHPSESVFATGGDDFKIKLWDADQGASVATLAGHLDYIRTVQFHRAGQRPWLVSASDDQTLRVWNWRLREPLAVLSGHHHYAMSAQFHPTQDLVVSASLDLTVCVWDLSALGDDTDPEEEVASEGSAATSSWWDCGCLRHLTLKQPYVQKHMLEGHERGVNWASFHPKLPLIVSGSDDRTVRIWRMDGSRAFEVDQLRGHTNNVCCVMFGGDNRIVSVSEDRTIRVWDMEARTLLQLYRREQARFWIVNMHPTQHLLAAGDDFGLLVFKLERERPAMCLADQRKSLLFVRDRELRKFEFGRDASARVMCTFRRSSHPARSIGVNPGDGSILVGYDGDDDAVYEQLTMPQVPDRAPADVRRGLGLRSPVFFEPGKFAGLDKDSNIAIHAVGSAEAATTHPPPKNTDRLFRGPPGLVCCRSDVGVALFDVAKEAAVAETTTAPNVKHVVWDGRYERAALLSKDVITVVTRGMEPLAAVKVAGGVKSACFDDAQPNVLVYSTHDAIKVYTLNTDETKTLCALDGVVYLARATNGVVWYVDRAGQVGEKRFDGSAAVRPAE
eukprot:CAMPEP_0174854916 /NCGR_PEP_ID=MMETSP1114-20130205/32010_1 /TAXON_ID=312471 /ORGANISM="Neobodo designis, Strain CCAP 1951/1" /LENGTH=622 /DNA_ID=CAMNT_0016089625 /DNA_START=45 /DNA_END=1913 /DNA_ORIENTATION=-